MSRDRRQFKKSDVVQYEINGVVKNGAIQELSESHAIIEPIGNAELKDVVNLATVKPAEEAIPLSPILTSILDKAESYTECPFTFKPAHVDGYPIIEITWNQGRTEDEFKDNLSVPLHAFIRENDATVDIVFTQPFSKVFTITKTKNGVPLMNHVLKQLTNFGIDLKGKVKNIIHRYAVKHEKICKACNDYVTGYTHRVFEHLENACLNNKSFNVLNESVKVEGLEDPTAPHNVDTLKKFIVKSPKQWIGPIVKELPAETRAYLKNCKEVEIGGDLRPCDYEFDIEEHGRHDIICNVAGQKKFYITFDDAGKLTKILRLS